MLTIRPEQLAVFSKAQVKRFEDSMLAHLKKSFPKQCEGVDEAQLRDTIQHGIKRAAIYEITDEADVSKYIDLMMSLGRDLDTDTKLPWASEILKTRSHAGAKISELVETAEKKLRENKGHG
jgi:hypothetical protein